MQTGYKVLFGVVGTILGAGTLLYLATGRREEDSPFIPNSVEDHIDRLVAFLDRTIGKPWVDLGLDALQSRLSLSYPGMTGVLNAVFYAEQQGRRLGWIGVEKRAFAAQRLSYA